MSIKKIVIGMVFGNSLLAQDTIRFMNDDVKQVKVQEIGHGEVRYRLYNNLQGALYIAGKSEIYYIKYANGLVDTLQRKIAAAPTTTIQAPVLPGKIHASGRAYVYMGRTMNYVKTLRYLDEYSARANRPELKKLTNKAWNKYYLKKGFGVAAIPAFSAGAVSGFFALSFADAFGNPPVGLVRISVTCLVAGVIAETISIIAIKRLRKTTRKAVDLYNTYTY